MSSEIKCCPPGKVKKIFYNDILFLKQYHISPNCLLFLLKLGNLALRIFKFHFGILYNHAGTKLYKIVKHEQPGTEF